MGGRGVKKQTFIMFAFAGWAALKIPQELLSRRCGNSEYSPQVFALLSSSVACCVLLVTAGIQNTIPKSLRPNGNGFEFTGAAIQRFPLQRDKSFLWNTKRGNHPTAGFAIEWDSYFLYKKQMG